MPSKSPEQEKFFGAVMGAKKGQKGVKGAAKKVAKKMSKKTIKKFLKKESLDADVKKLLEQAETGCGFDLAYQHVMSMYMEKLDAVGQEDDDVDNDGDSDETDEYLKNRRKKVGNAIHGKEEAEEHMHCKHAEQGCDCDECEECKANQE